MFLKYEMECNVIDFTHVQAQEGKAEGDSIVRRWFNLEEDPEICVADEFWLRKQIEEKCDKEAVDSVSQKDSEEMEIDAGPGKKGKVHYCDLSINSTFLFRSYNP